MSEFYLVVCFFIELSKVADKLVPLFFSASLLTALITMLLLVVRGKM
ncbi:MAG: hypothetical protein RR068_02465 [Hafnia sp.]